MDEEHSIIHVSGGARRCLRLPPGSPTSNLLLVDREELRAVMDGEVYLSDRLLPREIG